MSRSFEEVRELALQLSPEQRLILADWLYGSVQDEDVEDEAEVAAAWDEEIKRRLDEIDSGQVEMISHEEFMAGLREQAAKKRPA